MALGTTTYYVEPYQPPAPTVSTVVGNANALDVNVNASGSEHTSVEYGIYCTTLSQWVQTNGTLGGSPATQTESVWGTIRIGGLSAGTNHTFFTRAYNYYDSDTFNDSPIANATTDTGGPPAPANFRCIDCSSTTITWAWNDVAGENGYTLYDNATDGPIIRNLPQSSEFVIETALSPNTSYARYIKSFELGTETGPVICNSYNAATGVMEYDNVAEFYYRDWMDPVTTGLYGGRHSRAFIKFDIDDNLPALIYVTEITLYANCFDAQTNADARLDITRLDWDAIPSSPYDQAYADIGAGVRFLDNSTAHQTTGLKAFLLNGEAHLWLEEWRSKGDHATLGFYEETEAYTDDCSRFRQGDYNNPGTYPNSPWMGVKYREKTYSGASNVVEACTLANVPTMDNTVFTFTFANENTITAQIGDNGNPGGTTIQLEYAKGDADGPTEAWNPEIQPSFTITVTGLESGTTYWFRARAQNWASIWTGYCSNTTWRTVADTTPPVLTCAGCSSTTITWAWTDSGTRDIYEIFDNISGNLVIGSIPGDATYTIETGLSPNTYYTRHVRGITNYDYTGYSNCSCTDTRDFCGSSDSGGTARFGFFSGTWYYGATRFDLANISDIQNITGAKLYIYFASRNTDPSALCDITEVNGNTNPCDNNVALREEIKNGTVYLAGSDAHLEDSVYKILQLDCSAHAWIASCQSKGWCVFGFNEVGSTTNMASVESYFSSDPPILEITYSGKRIYSDNSNAVAVCTLAAVPFMDNTMTTFTAYTCTSITVQVGAGGNPASTPIQLLYAKGDQNGPTEAFTNMLTQTSGYLWDVTGLDNSTSYWFQARAKNQEDIWSDNCAITVWSTAGEGAALPAPGNFTCNDCSSSTLDWQWDDVAGEDGYTIFDADTDLPVISDIPADETGTTETGLAPNTTYRRYIMAYYDTPLDYLYAENPNVVSHDQYSWKSAASLNLGVVPNGEKYLVIGAAQFMRDDADSSRRAIIALRKTGGETGQEEATGQQYRSFMASEVLTGDGSTDYTYDISFCPALTADSWARVQNAAIIAIKVDPAWNFAYNDNSTGWTLNTASWTKHSSLDISAGSPTDFLVVHRSGYRWQGGANGVGGYSRLYNTTGTSELSFIYRDPPGDWNMYLQGGFTLLPGVTSITLESQFRGTSTSYGSHAEHVHLASLALDNEIWNGYDYNFDAGESMLPDAAWRYATYMDISVPQTQDYLILGSIGLRYNDMTGTEYAEAKLDVDGTDYDHMMFYPYGSTNEYAAFAAMKKIRLPAGTPRVSVIARSSSDSIVGYIKQRSIIAIPLLDKEYGGQSGVVEACTLAAVPVMDNSTGTFTFSNENCITAGVGDGGNPAGTTIELFYADGDAVGPISAFSSAGVQTSGYSWTLGGLTSDTSYWFQARAQNWAGVWSDNCAITVCSTIDSGPITPSNFACIDCTSTTLTWTWSDVGGEDGYQIIDNSSGSIVIDNIAPDSIITIETGLSPNTTYRRHIRSYVSGASGAVMNCSALASGYVLGASSKNADYPAITRDYTTDYLGFYKFDLSGLSPGLEVTAVRFYVYVYNTVPNPASLDITKVTLDPVTTGAAALDGDIRSGVVYVNNNTLHRSGGAKSVLFDNASHSWIENSVSSGWCAIGLKEDFYYGMDEARYAEWDCSTSFRAPMLEITYNDVIWSNASNAVDACTLAAVPTMTNSGSTFSQGQYNIAATVGAAGNPANTVIELFYST
ncbi:MAG: hypothetical protein ACYS8W_05315, partial [Planctomycetota bacterium]